MDLWIRTQRKDRLCKAYNFVIREANKQGYYAIAENRNKNTIEYGIYNSKERALEVLDEIQDLLEDDTINFDDDGYPTLLKNNVVYEMPKE